MDFEFDPQNERIRHIAREIADTVVARTAAKHDQEYSMPMETMAACHASGLFKLFMPKRFGGEEASIISGSNPYAHLIVLEEFGRVDMATAHCFQVFAHTCQLLVAAGTPQQHDRWFPQLAAGEGLLSWTGGEPGRTARGHLNNQSIATPDGEGGYRLDGLKVYGTNATDSAWNVIALSVKDMPAPQSFLLVLVPRGAPGFEVDAQWWRPTGMRAAVSPKLLLKDIHVPSIDVLGGPGFYPSSGYGSRWHLGFAANHLGAAQGLFDFTVKYLPERGTTSNPHSQRSVGEMRMRIAAATDMVHHAAWLFSKQEWKQADEYALMAKLFAIETAEWMVSETIRVAGSTALLEHFPVHRMIRDIHVHSTHANLYSTAQLVGRSTLGLDFDAAQQQ
ncbi:MAG TPA: acyl-CoA dehydrogenase family protein [Ramlibacter sp.]|jgi:alkylation response protein AidB-like acyl-CoA dehydrogenase